MKPSRAEVAERLRTIERGERHLIYDHLGCLDFQLGQVANFEIDFPYSFLHSDTVRSLIFGATFAQLDAHRPLG